MAPTESPPSEAWLFAQAILGKPIPRIVNPETEARAKRDELARLAQISPSHAEQLWRLQCAEAESRRQRELLEWCAQISTECESKLRMLEREEAESREDWRRAEQFTEMLHEGIWDPGKHPKGAFPQNRGWWSPTGGSGSGTSPSQVVTGPAAQRTPSAVSANSGAIVGEPGDLPSRFHLIGDATKGDVQNPFRLTSASSKDHAIAQAAAKGDLGLLKDLINSGGLSAGERNAAQAAINRLTSTAQKIISKELKATVMRRFPREMLKVKLKDIMTLARGRGPLAEKAKTALKLLKDNRFKKKH